MCCVGFLCRVIGLSDTQILGIPSIAEVQQEEFHAPFHTDWLHQDSGEDVETPEFFDLYKINDDEDRDDDQREAYLIEQAAPLGIDFEFVN